MREHVSEVFLRRTSCNQESRSIFSSIDRGMMADYTTIDHCVTNRDEDILNSNVLLFCQTLIETNIVIFDKTFTNLW